MLVRRMATVTICVPLASSAARVCAKSLYLPVHTSRRDEYSRPAMVRVSGVVMAMLAGEKCGCRRLRQARSEEHTSELQSLMRISYAVFCLKKKMIHKDKKHNNNITITIIIE